MDKPPRPTNRDEFGIALICALPIESTAVEALFDGYWRDTGGEFEKALHDTNTYTTGWIGVHNVVLAYMSNMGKASAAITAACLRSSFSNIRLALVVGICGGVPTDTEGKDIMLGDVIISTGVVQSDLSRQYPHDFIRKDTVIDNLPRPRPEIGTLLHKLRSKECRARLELATMTFTQALRDKPGYECLKHPGAEKDKLYEPDYRHKHRNAQTCSICSDDENPGDSVCSQALESSCEDLGCEVKKLILRKRRNGQNSLEPVPGTLHFGTVSSFDTVLKSGLDRDRLAEEQGVIAFEMEGSGVWDVFPTLIVKAVCDYADSHKNNVWQVYASISSAACMKAVLNEWSPVDTFSKMDQSSMSKTIAASVGVARAVRTQNQSACLQSLAFPEMFIRKYDIKGGAPTTCTWLNSNCTYTEWISQPRGLLWIKGHPGAGKSTLMKYAVTHAKKLFKNELVVSYFFHGRGAPIQKNALGFFRCVLHQILDATPELLSRLTKIFTNKCDTIGTPGVEWNWHEYELRNFFETSVAILAKKNPLRLYVDALDECGPEIASGLVEWFEHVISSASSDMNLSICFACRHYPIISLNEDYTIYVEQMNYNGISSYTRIQLARTRFTDNQVQDLTQMVISKAHGIFQWVRIVVPDILKLNKQGKPFLKVKEKILYLPTELSDLYKEILQKIPPDDLPQSLLLMQWIGFAIRPLSLIELRYAMVVGPNEHLTSLEGFMGSTDWIETDEEMERAMISLSGGLAEIADHEGKKIVQFIHQSVSDYLLETGFQEMDGSLTQDLTGHIHLRLLRSCLRYLIMPEVFLYRIPTSILRTDGDEILSRFPFISYAIIEWIPHAAIVDKAGIDLPGLLALFRWPSNDIITHLSRISLFPFNNGVLIIHGINLLHSLCYLGLWNLTRAITISSKDYEINLQDSGGFTPIMYATNKGHDARVDHLLKLGADINAQCKIGRTLLMHAIDDLSMDFRIQSRRLRPLPMLIRRTNTYPTKTIHDTTFRQIMEAGADLNKSDCLGQTALMYGIVNSNYDGVKQLLQAGADVHKRDSKARTALIYAAKIIKAHIVEKLLQAGADTKAVDRYR